MLKSVKRGLTCSWVGMNCYLWCMNWDTGKIKHREMDNEKKDSDSILLYQVVYVCALIVGVILSLMLVGVCGVILVALVTAAWTALQDVGWSAVWVGLYQRVIAAVFMVVLVGGPFVVKWAWKRLNRKENE